MRNQGAKYPWYMYLTPTAVMTHIRYSSGTKGIAISSWIWDYVSSIEHKSIGGKIGLRENTHTSMDHNRYLPLFLYQT